MGLVDAQDRRRLNAGLARFHARQHALPGIQQPGHRDSYVSQLLDSMRRVRHMTMIGQRPMDPRRADPESDVFDPHRGASYMAAQGQLDEAFWLVFISVHFGKNRLHGWRCARVVYGGLSRNRWSWARVAADPNAFRRWLRTNQATFAPGGPYSGFGNHRKYQSLDADSANGTGSAFVTYVNWVNPPRSHSGLLQDAINTVGDDPRGYSRFYASQWMSWLPLAAWLGSIT